MSLAGASVRRPLQAGTRVRARPSLLLALFITGIVTFTLTGRADAHAYLSRSEPSAGQLLPYAPEIVRLWFTEPPEARFTTVQVFSSSGATLQTVAMAVTTEDPNRAIAPLAPLPDGAYVIAWRTVSSVDGHETAGSFPIGVGGGPDVEAFLAATTGETFAPEQTSARTALRALTYFGSSLVIGAPVFGLVVLGPVFARRREHASVLVESGWQVGVAGVALSAVALLWSIEAQAADGSGAEPLTIVAEGIGPGSPLAVLIGSTRFGQVAIARAIGLALIGIAFASTRDARRARPDQRVGRRRWGVAVLLGALLPVTVSLNSHGAAQPIESGAILADWLHIVAMGTWVGGLLTLTLTVTRARSVIRDGADYRVFISSMVERFSPLAAVCVATTVVTGAWQTWVLAGSVEAILSTAHGWALLLKLALVVAMLAVAGINLVYTRPALAREAAVAMRERSKPLVAPAEQATDAQASAVAVISHTPGATAVLEAVSGVVVVLMIGVLLVSAVLTQLPPSREAYDEATRGTFREATVDGVRLRLRLNPGRPGYNVATLWANDRSGALTEITSSRIVVRMTDHEMGEAEVRLVPRTDGSYVAGTGAVAMSGTYEIEAIVRREGRDDIRVTFPAIAYAASAIDAGDLAAVRQAPVEARAVRNPLASTPESLDRGRTIYLQSCAACHGITGKGDGAAAAAIRPPLPDLNAHVPLHPDGELWWFITNGIAGRPMPAWREVLTDDERWDVVNYLRAAFGKDGGVATPTPSGPSRAPTATPPAR
jgi:copper transport protein